MDTLHNALARQLAKEGALHDGGPEMLTALWQWLGFKSFNELLGQNRFNILIDLLFKTCIKPV